jgi:cation diffusion facilitator CzcD-associated flavoprotein CzcO
MSMTAPPASPSPEVVDVLIVGAGFAGIGLAMHLQTRGVCYRVLEQAGAIGGTWRDNIYPGAACDIPSLLYCYSFAPNPAWSRMYPPQAEIQAYLEDCVDRHGVRPQLALGDGVVAARFDGALGLWFVDTASGERHAAWALVLATGGLSRPRWPDIAGWNDFTGPRLHTARWDPSLPLAGRRVGVVGTGASAIQLVPELLRAGAEVTVFQRTPPWIVPKFDRVLRPTAAGARWRRRLMDWRFELRAIPFTRARWLLPLIEPIVKLHLRWQVRDPALRARLTPHYRVGCKRVLLSNDWYPALQHPRAHLVDAPIERITRDGVRTRDGVLHGCDVLVAATGFHAAEQGAPFPIHGRDGLSLDAAWRDGAEAYKGTTVAGFPNLFLLGGPNTGLGHHSIIAMLEAQFAYVLGALDVLRADSARVLEVSRSAQSRWNAWLQRRLARTVWNTGGCRSWYLTADGRNTTLWPGFVRGFRRVTRRFDQDAYVGVPEPAPPSPDPPSRTADG